MEVGWSASYSGAEVAMANFVAVPAETLEEFLTGKGFARTIYGQEIVYVRSHDKCPQLKIKVFTSIRVGRQTARDCGRDSIKVCVAFESNWRSFGVGKFPPVFRVTSVESTLERMLLRMREAYKRANE